jgi:Peptidase S24-like
MSESFLELTEGMIADGYQVRFHAQGYSMTPTINDGEAITVEPVDPEQVRRGDILLFRRTFGNARIVAHRVVRIRRGRVVSHPFVMRGDCSAGNENVRAQDVLGRVCLVERGGRTLKVGGLWGRRRLRLRHRLEQILQLIAVAISLTTPRAGD